MRWLRLAAALLLSVGTLLAADREFTVRGTITRPFEDGVVTVRHEAVAGYMPAMTMPFNVAPDAQPEAAKLRAGDEVEFKLRVVGETSAAYDFKIVGLHAAKNVSTRAVPQRRVKEGDTLPAFSLVDQSGASFSQEDLRGKFTLMTFIFTRCPVPDFCPRLSKQFQSIQQRLRSSQPDMAHSLQLVSVSIDPEFDTPTVLREYGGRYGADPKLWRLATGPAPEIEALRKIFSVYAEKSAAILDHTLATALIDSDLRVVQIWRGNKWTPDEVFDRLAQLRATGP